MICTVLHLAVPEQQPLQFVLRHQKQKKNNKKSCTLSTFLLPHFILSFFLFFFLTPFPTFFHIISVILHLSSLSVSLKKNTGPLKTTAFLCLSLQNLKSWNRCNLKQKKKKTPTNPSQ